MELSRSHALRSIATPIIASTAKRRTALIIGEPFPVPTNGRTFTGRPGADQLSNHEDRSAGPVQCSVGLSTRRTADGASRTRLTTFRAALRIRAQIITAAQADS